MISVRNLRESDPTLACYLTMRCVPLEDVIQRFLTNPIQHFESFLLRIKHLSPKERNAMWHWSNHQEMQCPLRIEQHIVMVLFYYYQSDYSSARARALEALSAKGEREALFYLIAMYLVNMDDMHENMEDFFAGTLQLQFDAYLENHAFHLLYSWCEFVKHKEDKRAAGHALNEFNKKLDSSHAWYKVCFGFLFLKNKKNTADVLSLVNQYSLFNSDHYARVMLQEGVLAGSVLAHFLLATYLR